jgi:hypothetical protein
MLVLRQYGEVMTRSGPEQRGSPDQPGPRHPGLSPQEVLASGGWHPRYARVLITVSDGDYGFALVDGNGDGAELEEELWRWEDGPGGHGHWEGGSSSGAGPLGYLPPLVAGGHIGQAYFAYGRVPGRESVTVQFDQRRYEIPVSPLGVWGFIKLAVNPRPGLPALLS